MRTNLRTCPECGSGSWSYWEIVDNDDGDELHDILECDECGCRYELVFVYAEKRALGPRRNNG